MKLKARVNALGFSGTLPVKNEKGEEIGTATIDGDVAEIEVDDQEMVRRLMRSENEHVSLGFVVKKKR